MALTDFRVSIIDKKQGNRVVVEIVDPIMVTFLEANERLVYSTKTDKPIRLTPNKPIATELLPDVVLLLQRCADELSDDKRGKGQLASPAQITRLRQLAVIIGKRKESVIQLPAKIETLSWTQVGRLISDLKAILIKEGLWDETNKCEIEKG